MGEKAEDSEAVVEGDDDETLPGQLLAVVDVWGGGPFDEASAVDPDQNGAMGVDDFCGDPDVEVEAVFADGVLRHEFASPGKVFSADDLHAACGELICITDA